ncbi:MAG: NepR family anti-sigma factor [Shimia sp.]
MVEEIDHNLKQAFDDVASEPIPDRLKDLLAQLKAQDEKAAAEAANEEGGAHD